MIKVLFEDKFIVVCVKPTNILSELQSNTHRTMPEILKKMTGAYQIDTIHRLDKMVGGTMVYSKSRNATKVLSNMVRDRKIIKEYLSVVHGRPDPEAGEMTDILFKDSQKNKSFVVKTMRRGAKDAKLEYQTLSTVNTDKGEMSLIKIRLHTGRTHQIRVQFSSRKMPLVGDGKYGSHDNGCFIALWSHHLEFQHPTRKLRVNEFSLPPRSQYPWKLFSKTLLDIENSTRKDDSNDN